MKKSNMNSYKGSPLDSDIASGGISQVEYYQHAYTKSKYISERHENNVETLVDVFKTTTNGKLVVEFLLAHWAPSIQFSFEQRYIRIKHKNGLIDVNFRGSITEVEVIGARWFVDGVLDSLKEKFGEISVTINWLYSDDGASFEIPLSQPKHIPSDSSYPYIAGGIDNFIDEYKESSENILLLLGKPGTGKSTFIKYLLNRIGRDAMVTYDTKILGRDYFFGDFIQGDKGVLVMEDADAFLEARSSGNELMHKFLNVGDGIVSAPNKKIIFTTNLDSLDSVDKALLRPGRCFSVVNFRPLANCEAIEFMEEHDPAFDVTELTLDEYTLAELYNKIRNRTITETKSKFGFY
jgi:predicted GTPase